MGVPMENLRKLLMCGACFVASAVTLQSQTLFGNPSGNYFTGFTNSTAGASFTVGSQAISVSALGAFDAFQDGNNRAHDVGLWQAGVLIASVTVPAGTGGTLFGDYRYITLGSSLTLSANTTYTIGAFFDIVPAGNDMAGAGGTSVLDPAFSSATPMLFDGYEVNPSLAEPTLPYYDLVWAANLQYTVVPEPSSFALLAGGLGALLFARSRRKA